MTRQGNKRQDKTRHDNTKQYTVTLDKARGDKTIQHNTTQYTTIYDKIRQHKIT